MPKKNLSDKEKALVEKISKAKSELDKLQKKQKLEIGALAYKHGLNQYNSNQLDSAFKKLSEELNLEHA
jgi:hypothetical protein